jgi:hypothetical protein
MAVVYYDSLVRNTVDFPGFLITYMFAQIDAREVESGGSGGLIQQMVKAGLERGLAQS